MTSPVVAGENVVVATGERRVRAYNRRNGKQVAELSLPGYSAMANPKTDSGVVVVGMSDSSALVAIDKETLKLLWAARLPLIDHGVGDVTPAITHQLIITTGTRSLRDSERFAGDAFAIKARMRLGLRQRQSITRQMVAAVDRCTGAVRWVRSLGVGVRVYENHSGTPVIADSGIFIGSPVLNEVLRLDLLGNVVWRTKVPGLAKGYVVVRNGSVIAATTDGRLMMLDQRSGRNVGAMSFEKQIRFFSPLVFDSVLVVATQAGGLEYVPVAPIRR
jgi:outer membrane protein assembly factor BamB